MLSRRGIGAKLRLLLKSSYETEPLTLDRIEDDMFTLVTLKTVPPNIVSVPSRPPPRENARERDLNTPVKQFLLVELIPT